MIIAVNTRLLLHGKLEGIGRFSHETLKIITREHPEHQFVFIFDRKFHEEFIYSGNIITEIGFPQARHPLLWYMFFEHSIPRILHKYHADIFLSPDGWLSLRSDTKSLPVIHDLNFFHLPECIPWHVRKYYHYFFPRFVQKATRIATVSDFSKQDIISSLHFDPAKIDVVYNGVNENFKPTPEEKRKSIRDTYTRQCPYFLFVGLIHPRKNITRLIKAFNAFKRATDSNVKLLIVGSKKWWTSEMQAALDESEYQEEIIFTGRIPDHDLYQIMGSALSLIYPSHFEGFGIPVLEAMYCDVPVITSDTTSMPEVGGDAVLYINPASVDSMASAMIALFRDADLRKKLINKGKTQRMSFTWKQTAAMLWDSIMQCTK